MQSTTLLFCLSLLPYELLRNEKVMSDKQLEQENRRIVFSWGDGRQFFSTYLLLNDTPGRSTKVKKTRETRRIAGKKESADKKSAEEAQENKN